jgi:hypothetical protein
MSKKSDDKQRQLQELALSVVRLQRPLLSSEEQRLLAENLINALLGRGRPMSRLDSLVAEIHRNHPEWNKEQIREELIAFGT